MFYLWLKNFKDISEDEYSGYPAWLQLQLSDEYLDACACDVSKDGKRSIMPDAVVLEELIKIFRNDPLICESDFDIYEFYYYAFYLIARKFPELSVSFCLDAVSFLRRLFLDENEKF